MSFKKGEYVLVPNGERGRYYEVRQIDHYIGYKQGECYWALSYGYFAIEVPESKMHKCPRSIVKVLK